MFLVIFLLIDESVNYRILQSLEQIALNCWNEESCYLNNINVDLYCDQRYFVFSAHK